jgi:hypothetical protein
MSDTFVQILALVSRGDYLVSSHAYDELLNDRISADDLLQGLADAETIEDYPDAGRGPSVLLLQYDPRGAVHTVWGMPKPHLKPAVLITAYRPDPKRWSPDFRQRRA